jgi:hypothetical protein
MTRVAVLALAALLFSVAALSGGLGSATTFTASHPDDLTGLATNLPESSPTVAANMAPLLGAPQVAETLVLYNNTLVGGNFVPGNGLLVDEIGRASCRERV